MTTTSPGCGSSSGWRSRITCEFHLTARENVGFGDIERLDDTDAIMDAVRGAAAQEMVERLPSGLDTMLGRTLGEGTDLSGGQWQKLALARAFFRDGAVLILDEPTAALDARAEHELFEQILARAAGAPRSSSRTVSRQCAAPTVFSCSMKGRSWRTAITPVS